jgi:hypothetical protein
LTEDLRSRNISGQPGGSLSLLTYNPVEEE